MSYAKALVTLPSQQSAIWNIQSQAELELGRNLNNREENLLMARYSADQLSSQIDKV